MNKLENYLKTTNKNLEVEVFPQKKKKEILIIKGLSNPDYQVRIIYLEIIKLETIKKNDLKAKLFYTYLRMNFDFDTAKLYESNEKFVIDGSNLGLSKSMEFHMWIIRTIDSLEKGLKEFYENDKE